MNTDVDYLSISLPFSEIIYLSEDGTWKAVGYLKEEKHLMMAEYLLQETKHRPGGKFDPYTDSTYFPSLGCTYLRNPKLSHCLIQFTGQGCEILRQHGILQDMLFYFHENVTRIDVFQDIECDTPPDEFVQQRRNKRFRGDGHIKEDEGHSEYVGSQKSDRYACVYRYNVPHPRHKLLRIEYRNRRKLAKKIAYAVMMDGTDKVAAALGAVFGWTHRVYDPTRPQTQLELTAPRDRGLGKTEKWLFSQVDKAIDRLLESGARDLVIQWLIEQQAKVERMS